MTFNPNSEAFKKAEIELSHQVSHMGITVTKDMVISYLQQNQKVAA